MDKKPHDGKALLGQIAARMTFCNTQVRQYAICVSQKGINVNHHECQKQFGELLLCMGRPKPK